MQRSRLLATNADKQWEAERRGAKRDNIRLSHGLKEIEAVQMYHVNSMTKEQKRIQKDLERIKQATAPKKMTSSRGVPLDNRTGRLRTLSGDGGRESSVQGAVMTSGSSMTLQMRINDFMDGISSMKGNKEPVQNHTSDSAPSDTSVTDVNKSMSKTLSISEDPTVIEDNSLTNISGLVMDPGEIGQGDMIPQPSRSRRSSLVKDNAVLNPEMYLPNGQLRKMYTLPDLKDAMEEARKARYIRHRGKVESERELTVEEIFQRDTKVDPDNGNKVGHSFNRH